MFKKNNNRFLIKTPTGFEPFKGVQKKIVDSLYTITFFDGSFIKCSGNHVFLTEDGFKKANELTNNNTLTGKKISSITFINGTFEVFDPVGVDKHSTYYSNGVVSHNTEFLGSSNTLISGLKLQQIAYQTPITEHDKVKIYKPPVKGDDEGIKDHLYALVVDVAEGKGLDCSTFSVIDISATPYEQVATYKSSSVSPMLFPTEIFNAAVLYNNAYVLVEINNTPQVADILHQDLEYENLWKVFTGNKKPQQLSAGFARGVQLGLKMSPQVKRIGCSNLKTLIEGDKLIINDFDTYSELTTFVAQKNSFAAESDANDDMVMGLVMFGWISTQKYFKEIVNHDIRKQLQLENMNQFDEITPPSPMMDDGMENDFMLEGGDVWEKADGRETYSDYFREIQR
jgi:hypothetical protein